MLVQITPKWCVLKVQLRCLVKVNSITKCIVCGPFGHIASVKTMVADNGMRARRESINVVLAPCRLWS